MTSTMLWQALWEQGANPIALVDLQGRHVDVNPAMCRMLGYDRETLLKLLPAEVTHPDDRVLTTESIQNLAERKIDSFSMKKRLLCFDGSVVLTLVNSSLVVASDGNPQMIVFQFHDITDLYNSELLWRQTLDNTPTGMALMDLCGRYTEANSKLCELVSYRREELLGQRCTDLIYNGGREPVEELYSQFREGRVDSGNLEICLRHRDGHPFWILARLGLVRRLDEQPSYVISQYQALGEDAQIDKDRLVELTHKALHDPLTSLANRALLIDRLKHELAKLPEWGGVLAIFMIDLDGFKPINDRYGHETGDQLLQTMARRLLSTVRSNDTVARLGGDEFAVLAHLADRSQAENLHTRIIQQLNTEITLPSAICGSAPVWEWPSPPTRPRRSAIC